MILRAKEQNPANWLLIDGAYLCWRSYFSTPKLQGPNGEATGALHGFLGATNNALKETRAERCVIAWEGGSPTRDALFPEYKANRQEMPPDLSQGFELIQEIAPKLGWPIIQIAGLEADDVLFNLSKQCTGKKIVFTTDKDIISLVDENLLIYTKDKGKGWYLTQEYYYEKWGVHTKQIPDVLALCGDSIDGIPGVQGVGKKTATDLIARFGSIHNLLANINDASIKDKTRKAILESDTLEKSRQAIALIEHPLDMGALDFTPDYSSAVEKFEYLGMVKTAETYRSLQDQLPGI